MKQTVTFFILFCTCLGASAQRDYASLVNPFIGTGGHGHTYPGASVPFGMVQLSPDTRMADWDGSSGYHYSDSVIYGFSHTHLSGTGIPDYCDVLLMPFTGEVPWEKEQYRSSFSHKTEKAQPGYYEVLLERQGIHAQVTATTRAGMHQYRFPAGTKNGRVLIDLQHRDEVLESWIEPVSDHAVRGLRRSRSWARDQYLYFYMEFEQPIRSFVVRDDSGSLHTGGRVSGHRLKAYVDFSIKSSPYVRVRVGISAVSAEGARKNLQAEMKNWDFEALRNKARKAWNHELAKIDVQGGTPDQQTIFYTALYHTFLVPNRFQDLDGQYRGTDGKVHASEGFQNYSVFSLWDTYRAYHPLMTLINRERTAQWVNTFYHEYRNGGMLPVWELAGNETFCMIGYHSVPVILDATRKGIVRANDSVLRAMISYAESNRFGLPFYQQHGYLSNDHEHESVSKTLEYAYDDWCIAQYARLTGQSGSNAFPAKRKVYDSIYSVYIKRAQSWKNLFDPETHNMRGKLEARWQTPFDPREINNFFTEGNSWQYSFAVPQDIEGLMELHGGRDAFAAKLDELFTTSSQTTGRDQADVTGLIGQYAQGNEPSHHMAYLYDYAGQPWKTQELIQRICRDFYHNAPDGLIGNEDCGQMSAWYILSALGFYPVCPGTNEYAIGMPLFNSATLRFEDGKVLTIRKKGNQKDSSEIQYVNALSRNGKELHRLYLRHEELAAGGLVEFTTSGTAPKEVAWEAPHSRIDDPGFIPVPYFAGTTNKFKGSDSIRLKSMNPAQTIFYFTKQALDKPTRYSGPIVLDSSAVLYAFSSDQNGRNSPVVEQHFYRVPSDRTITVLSKVHPMYTAGGPDALIDGIEGTANWRTGEWQSYYDQDFEAIVDLERSRPVQYLGIHVLQEVSPWIVYPREVIFSASDDGINFREVARVANQKKLELADPETQELGTPVNVSARYIRIRAVSGGKLPAWHESAGVGSHLFIDEILIR